jgi:uncharacterized metal-binding protein YceD (DUF177 family)
MRMSERPWSIPIAVSDVPETGRHLDLVADAQARAAIARLAGVSAVPRLTASFDVTRHSRNGLRVVGQVSATVEQTCVVTLEPMENAMEEPIDVVFTSALDAPRDMGQIEVSLEDAPEALVDGTVDLGALATEFLILGIDPYPRKPGAVFQSPAVDDDAARPFAALAALKKARNGDDG